MLFRTFMLLLGTLLLLSLSLPFGKKEPPIDPQSSVSDLLLKLGAPAPDHLPDLSLPGVSAEAGEALVTRGIASKPGGGKTGKQSAHFVCTSCHNIRREDPDLSRVDPQARLEYAAAEGLPYLPGTTLYGAVNRRTFYNGDYEKKYGKLVEQARHSLRESIQLCATECSQGRLLEAWELESVLAYLWTIDLKLGDLQLSESEKQQLEQALAGKGNQEAARELLHSKYLSGAPATFVKPPEDRREGYPLSGNADNGRLIYERSCLHCHGEQRYAFFELDESRFSFRHLQKHLGRYTRYSIYQVIRYGTQPIPGKRAYMPQYTEEKLSDQQVEDLRAYIEQEAQ